MAMVLMIRGKAAKVGQKVKDFRGNVHTITGWREPHKPSSSGRVYTDQGEFFPEVVKGKFVEVL